MIDERADDDDGAGDTAHLRVRRASAADYAAFARLLPELEVDDPTPSPHAWEVHIAPSTFVAETDGNVVGYCFCQELDDTGYVRNIVVAPAARGRGVGRALMQVAADHLRRQGKRFWRLNVKPDNQAALALYHRMGMHAAYASVALRFPWAALDALPVGEGRARRTPPERDAAMEDQFALPRGQLAAARQRARLLFEATSDGGGTIGMAVFDPGFPGAFPFRTAAPGAVATLLRAIRAHAAPEHSFVALVVEDDDRLRALLVGAGAQIRHETVHLTGTL